MSSDIFIWHGDENIATIDNQAGEHTDTNGNLYSLPNMFDNDRLTLWQNHASFTAPIIIGFNFKVFFLNSLWLDPSWIMNNKLWF